MKRLMCLAAVVALALGFALTVAPTEALAQAKGKGGAKAAAPRPPAAKAAPKAAPVAPKAAPVAPRPAGGASYIGGARPANLSPILNVGPGFGGGFPAINAGPVYGSFPLVNSGSVYGPPLNVNSGSFYNNSAFNNNNFNNNLGSNFGGGGPVVASASGSVFNCIPPAATTSLATTPIYSNAISPLRWGGGVIFGPGFDPAHEESGNATPGQAVAGAHSYYPPVDVMKEKQAVMPGVEIAHLKRVASAPANLQIHVPPNAELWFNGVKMQQTGQQRQFVTPDLPPGKSYAYEVRVRWQENGREVEQTHTVTVQAGGEVVHSFLGGSK